MTSGGIIKYYTLDNDPQGSFEFTDVSDIPGDLQFLLIIANQIFEHLSISESISMMCHLSNHLESGGSLIATIPNFPNMMLEIRPLLS